MTSFADRYRNRFGDTLPVDILAPLEKCTGAQPCLDNRQKMEEDGKLSEAKCLETEAFTFHVRPQTVFNLLKEIHEHAEKIGGKKGGLSKEAMSRATVVYGEEIFRAWAPEGIAEPRVFAHRQDAAAAGTPNALLSTEVWPTHIFALLTKLQEADGGGAAAAADFRSPGMGGGAGPDVEGVGDVPAGHPENGLRPSRELHLLPEDPGRDPEGVPEPSPSA